MESGLKNIQTPIAGVFLVTRTQRGDERGFFERLYCRSTLEAWGWDNGIAQVNHSFTAERGTCRGMHYQSPPFAEHKLVSCLHGAVWDVVLDLRRGSPTFLQHFSVELSEQNGMALLIPPGCAHGFQTLVAAVDLLYCHSAAYAPPSEAGVHMLDERLKFTWPLPITQLSARDAAFPHLPDDFEGVSIEMPSLSR